MSTRNSRGKQGFILYVVRITTIITLLFFFDARYVDNAKRELLAYIQERSNYFEQRGAYLNQKWDSLKQFI